MSPHLGRTSAGWQEAAEAGHVGRACGQGCISWGTRQPS